MTINEHLKRLILQWELNSCCETPASTATQGSREEETAVNRGWRADRDKSAVVQKQDSLTLTEEETEQQVPHLPTWILCTL